MSVRVRPELPDTYRTRKITQTLNCTISLFSALLMHIELYSDILFQAIKTVAHAVVSSPTTPILENILFRATNEKLTLIASNLEMAIEYTIEQGIQIHEPGEITISYRFLGSYLGLLDPTTLTLKTGTGYTVNFTANKQKMRYK
jgi:DNA polymerase III sliding clamp (beta) subunit (PCNA family)